MAHPRAYSGVAVTAGELPLAPTLHVVQQRNTARIISTIYTGITSRSCRGDREVARHIRMEHPRTSRGCCHRGRASTRPYIACCTAIKYGADYINKNTPRVASRSCRGDWEVARPSAWRTHAYSGVAVTAGELPLAPTLHVVHQ